MSSNRDGFFTPPPAGVPPPPAGVPPPPPPLAGASQPRRPGYPIPGFAQYPPQQAPAPPVKQIAEQEPPPQWRAAPPNPASNQWAPPATNKWGSASFQAPPAAAKNWGAPPPPPTWEAPPPPPPPPLPTAAAASAGNWAVPPKQNQWNVPSYPNQMVHGSGSAPMRPPPLPGTAAKLDEQFKALSFVSAPGTADTTTVSLPRPCQDNPLAPEVNEQFTESCHERYVKLTTHAIPNAHSLAARLHFPLGGIIHPLARAPQGEEVPVVDFGPPGIVRCRRCRTYINPFVTFTDNGKYFRCCICNMLNEVPAGYYCALDSSDRRYDAMDRPELCCASADLVAQADYMVRPPMPPSYFFLIDVSSATVKSGMLNVVVDTIKSCLDKLPGYPRTQIGFMTFDSTLHFYNLKSSLKQPHMIIMGQLDDVFLPVPADDLMVNLSESRAVVEALLDRLPSLFANNNNIESALGPALQATISIMGELGGKLLIFQSTLPSLGVGRLKLRGEKPNEYGTDKECLLRVAEDPFYKQTAAECTKLQIGVNVYAFYEKYTDVASLGTLSKITGGQVYYYPAYSAIDAERLRYDLNRDLTRETVWEAVMRIRCGKGLKYSGYQGHFMLRSSDLLALPALDCDKTFAVEFFLDETLLTSQLIYFQVALLYTSSAGERRIRVHTVRAPVVSDLATLYQAANQDAIIGVMSRIAIEKTFTDKLENARQFVQSKMCTVLREYRHLFSVQHNLAGRFVFPETLTLLPLYSLTLCKTLALRGGYLEVPLDVRSAMMYEMMIMSLPRLLRLLYPLLIRLDEYLTRKDDSPPRTLNLTQQSLSSDGAYLLFDGLKFALWVGKMAQADFVYGILGPNASSRQTVIPELDNDLSRKLRRLLTQLRKLYPECYQPCTVVMEGDASAEISLVFSNMYEDRVASFPSYDEWMVQTHRHIQH